MKNIIIYNISQVIIMCLPFTSLKKDITWSLLTRFRQAQFLRTMAPPAPPQKITLLEEEPWSPGFFSNFHMKNVGLWEFVVMWRGWIFFDVLFFCFFFQMVVQWWTGWILKPTWGCGTGKLRRTKGRERPCQLKMLYGAALSSSFSLVQEQ